MNLDIKTVDGWEDPEERDPLYSLRNESIGRMKSALLACSLDNPYDARAAIQQVTILRVYHQVTRIVQYLDLMDKLEERMYKEIEHKIENIRDICEDPEGNLEGHLFQLMNIQEKIQASIIESNKLLAPYLDIQKYPVFEEVVVESEAPASVIALPSEKRNMIRESAGDILQELSKLSADEPELV